MERVRPSGHEADRRAAALFFADSASAVLRGDFDSLSPSDFHIPTQRARHLMSVLRQQRRDIGSIDAMRTLRMLVWLNRIAGTGQAALRSGCGWRRGDGGGPLLRLSAFASGLGMAMHEARLSLSPSVADGLVRTFLRDGTEWMALLEDPFLDGTRCGT